MYYVFTKEYFDYKMPWSLYEDGWLACFKSWYVAEQYCKSIDMPVVLMKASKEHLDFVKEY